MTLATSYAGISSPQHCLKGEGGEIKIILDCFQIVYYDLTISLNIFCEGLLVHIYKKPNIDMRCGKTPLI